MAGVVEGVGPDVTRFKPGDEVFGWCSGAFAELVVTGGVGTFAVQLAKHFGAEVTAVCSTRNVELVRSIKADHVVDYTREDFTRSGKQYDLILDVAGRPALLGCRRSLKPGGRLVLAAGDGGRWLGPLDRMTRGLVLGRFGTWTVRVLDADENREDALFLAELLAAGALTPVIDRTYDLTAAPEAVRYLEVGHTQGKVVVTV